MNLKSPRGKKNISLHCSFLHDLLLFFRESFHPRNSKASIVCGLTMPVFTGGPFMEVASIVITQKDVQFVIPNLEILFIGTKFFVKLHADHRRMVLMFH